MKKFTVLCSLTVLLLIAAGIHAQEVETPGAPRLEFGRGASFTDLEDYEEAHLFTVLMRENTDAEAFSFFHDDFANDGRLHLRAGDYEVLFLTMGYWSESLLGADVELVSVEASPCAVGRDNRVFVNTVGWDAIMFCDGHIDWSVTSDNLLAIMLVLRLDMDDGADDGRALPYNGNTTATLNAGNAHSLP